MEVNRIDFFDVVTELFYKQERSFLRCVLKTN